MPGNPETGPRNRNAMEGEDRFSEGTMGRAGIFPADGHFAHPTSAATKAVPRAVSLEGSPEELPESPEAPGFERPERQA